MTPHDAGTEAKLANEQITFEQSLLHRERRTALTWACVPGVVSMLLAVGGYLYLAFCVSLIAAYFLIQYFDHNGHNKELGRRKQHFLYPRGSAKQSSDPPPQPDAASVTTATSSGAPGV